MNTSTPRYLLPTPRKPSRRQEVEAKLHLLRDNNRLGIHMNEDIAAHRYTFSTKTQENFTDDAQELLPKLVPSKENANSTALPILSASLLPPRDRSMRPYGATEEYASAYGYLIDLSQDVDFPPRVIAARERGILSGYNSREKKYWAKRDHGVCKDIYAPFTQHSWLSTLATPEGAALTCGQLDALAAYYSANTADINSLNNDPHIFEFNEILVASAKQHITAISIPIYDQHYFDKHDLAYKAQADLIGAIVGIDHLNKGIKLPVTLYHVSGSAHVARGASTYLGEGRKELVDIALGAISTLQSDYCVLPLNAETLRKPLKEVLNIDLDIPLSEQEDKVLELRRSYQESSHSRLR